VNSFWFLDKLSWNLEASASWNPQGLCKPVIGLIYLYLTPKTKLNIWHCPTRITGWNNTNTILTQNHPSPTFKTCPIQNHPHARPLTNSKRKFSQRFPHQCFVRIICLLNDSHIPWLPWSHYPTVSVNSRQKSYTNCFITCDMCLFHDAVNISEDKASNFGKICINYALFQWIIKLFYLCVNFTFLVKIYKWYVRKLSRPTFRSYSIIRLQNREKSFKNSM
jgi:hypothetical protein